MSDKISVVVRVRPLLAREKNDKVHWKVQDKSLVQVTAQDKATATYSFGKYIVNTL